MSKIIKFLISTVITIVVLCSIVAVISLIRVKGDFTKLVNGNLKINSYEITQKFEDILIDIDTADIDFTLTNDEKSKVVCYEQDKVNHDVKVVDGALTISVEDTRKWYDYIGFNFGEQKITVYLTKTQYSSLVIKDDTGDIDVSSHFTFKNIDIDVSTGDVELKASATENVKITTTTGDISVENITATNLDVTATTGDVEIETVAIAETITANVTSGDVDLESVTVKNLTLTASTGNISLNDVLASQNISIETTTGNVIFDGADANEIVVETTTGNVKGTLLTNKKFTTKTSTGRIRVPSLSDGGNCKITTTTGDIILQIKQ